MFMMLPIRIVILKKEKRMYKTYEELVADQIKELSKDCPADCDPVGVPFPSNALWCLPFAKKPAKPSSDNTFSLVITEKAMMKIWGVPERYHAVEVEREIISAKNGVKKMIERVYLVRRSIFKKICVLTTISAISLRESNMVSIDSQFSNMMGCSRLVSFKAVELQELLSCPAPYTIALYY